MTDTPARRPGAIPVLIGVLLIVAATWFIFSSRTPQDIRECAALYTEARTAEDTTRIDLTVPPAATMHAEPRSCGSYRMSGRWQ